jgi:Phospholipase_D-nuclease N-terminal
MPRRTKVAPVRILLGIVIVLFLILWARAVIDVFRRHDLSVGGKAGWTIFMLILPFIGLLVYTMLRPANA